MIALSIQVRDASSGGPLDTTKSFTRCAAQFLPLVVPYIGSLYGLIDDLWPLWDANGQALHDKAAGTAVVNKR
jgi:uncharacterized RDD family membrane protein YckC